MLAEAYRHGEIPVTNETEVEYWYAESAKQGYEEAALKAGELYLANGNEGCAKWFFERAAASSRASQRYLRRMQNIEAHEPPETRPVNHFASLCDLGQTAERKGDNAIAFSLYGISAEAGYTRALYRLGLCYENAVGTPRDIDEALK